MHPQRIVSDDEGPYKVALFRDILLHNVCTSS